MGNMLKPELDKDFVDTVHRMYLTLIDQRIDRDSVISFHSFTAKSVRIQFNLKHLILGSDSEEIIL
jgi:hypothetical protein